jgi:hypothetical protein
VVAWCTYRGRDGQQRINARTRNELAGRMGEIEDAEGTMMV